jgi:hypothetical protein
MIAMQFLRSLLILIHALAGAAWLGAMIYNWFVLHPRARRHFPRDDDFEVFIATVSRGTRYPVLTVLVLIGLSGLVLLFFHRPAIMATMWIALIAVKGVLYGVACVVFFHVSWYMWPARIFALPDEIPHIQITFRRVAAVMLAIVTLGMILGILTHTLIA